MPPKQAAQAQHDRAGEAELEVVRDELPRLVRGGERLGAGVPLQHARELVAIEPVAGRAPRALDVLASVREARDRSVMVEAELLRAIRERPDDDEPRLVYADWLTDRGDPRGEFIVLQCRLAKLDRDDDERRWMDRRRRELLDAHGPAWRRELDAIPTLAAAYFVRGFVPRVAMDESAFVAHAGALLAAAPLLEEVYLRGGDWRDGAPIVPPELARLRRVTFGSTQLALAALASPHLQGVERLELERECHGPSIVAALVRGRFDRLEGLGLGGTRLGNAGLRTLREWPGLARLTWLDLSRCELTEGIHELVSSPNVANLRHLNLWANPIGARGAREVVTSRQLTSLEELRLHETNAGEALVDATLPKLTTLHYGRNPLGPDTGAPLAGAMRLTSLAHLELDGDNLAPPTVDSKAVTAIVTSKHLPNLVSLELRQNRYGAAAATFLRAMRPGFRKLGLAYTDLDEEAAHALAGNPNVATLDELDLTRNPLSHRIVKLLAASPYLRPRVLHLAFTELGDKGVATLARSPILANIRYLDLHRCRLGDAAARSLARSPHLGGLTRLILAGNPITDAGAAALAASKRLRPLLELSLRNTEVTDAGTQALAALGHAVRP